VPAARHSVRNLACPRTVATELQAVPRRDQNSWRATAASSAAPTRWLRGMNAGFTARMAAQRKSGSAASSVRRQRAARRHGAGIRKKHSHCRNTFRGRRLGRQPAEVQGEVGAILSHRADRSWLSAASPSRRGWLSSWRGSDAGSAVLLHEPKVSGAGKHLPISLIWQFGGQRIVPNRRTRSSHQRIPHLLRAAD
jgi:hypothetical protein